MRLPKYAKNKQKGNLGEAFVQFVMSKYALVHKIDGSNDIGNDFICELIKNEYPTNILFYIQVKFTKNTPSISNTTRNYWKDSPIPVYIFWVKRLKIKRERIVYDFLDERYWSIKYKRMTPEIHKEESESYKAYNKNNFLKHLLIDYMRTLYWKGYTPIIKTSDFMTGEERLEIRPLEYNLLINDVIQEEQYVSKICNMSWAQLLSLSKIYLEKFNNSNKLEDIETAKKAIDLAGNVMYDNNQVPENFTNYEFSLSRKIEKEYNKFIKT